mgnify:CR=1 FL=1
MKAVNLTTSSVELDPVNGPGMLAPAVPESEGAHERELVETTARERALADAGTIALLDSKGRRQNPDPPAPSGGGDMTGGDR